MGLTLVSINVLIKVPSESAGFANIILNEEASESLTAENMFFLMPPVS